MKIGTEPKSISEDIYVEGTILPEFLVKEGFPKGILETNTTFETEPCFYVVEDIITGREKAISRKNAVYVTTIDKKGKLISHVVMFDEPFYASSKSSETDASKDFLSEEAKQFKKVKFIDGFDSLKLQWNNIKKYPLYALYLSTTIDKEANEYIKNRWKDLVKLSHKDCLIFTFCNKQLQSDLSILSHKMTSIRSDGIVVDAISDEEAYEIAREMKIRYSDLPCMVFFEDLYNDEFVVFPFRNLSSIDIGKNLRELFDSIRDLDEFSFSG